MFGLYSYTHSQFSKGQLNKNLNENTHKKELV